MFYQRYYGQAPYRAGSLNGTRSALKGLKAVQTWMGINKLKLNPEKTEFIIFGNKSQRLKLANIFPVNILGNQVSPSNSVRNLGVIFDSDISFSKHISSVVTPVFIIKGIFSEFVDISANLLQLCLQMFWLAVDLIIVTHCCMVSLKELRRLQMVPTKFILDVPYYDYKIHRSFNHLKASYAYSGPRLWNELLLHIRNSTSTGSFRNKLNMRKFLVRSC